MMAVCSWEPQLHVPNGLKGQMRMWKSSNGSAYILTSECVSKVIEPFTKWQVENATNGTMWNKVAKHAAARQVMQPPPRSSQGSGPKHCIIEQCIWAVHPAWLTGWSGSSVQTSRWCHGCQWASETGSWLKQTSRWCGRHRQWTNILVHSPTTNNGEWVLLLVGEGVRYRMSYCNIYAMHIYVSFIFKYILLIY